MIGVVSDWFWSYGFADARDDVLFGAYPLDAPDVTMLEQLGVKRVLNLAEDIEYAPGQRPQVERALAAAGIEETRVIFVDHGALPAEALERAVQTVVRWLDGGQRSYIHCRAGWQRSAAVAAGVIAVHDGLAIEQALDAVRVRKPSAVPLDHQRDDLIRWWNGRS
jgi:protein-tyrosine phosphatase